MPRSHESNNHRKATDARWRVPGLRPAFSLFEVLVVLVIVGLVSGICMTMVSQLRRNLDRYFPASEYYTRLEVRISMFSSTVASLVPSRLPADAFKGDPSTIVGLATYFPADTWPNEQKIRIALSSSGGQSLVKAERLDAKGVVQATFPLFSVPCERSSFSYLKEDMGWADQWEQQRQFPYLPLAVRFSCEATTQSFHTIAAVEREGHAIMMDVNLMQLGQQPGR